jgi:hypothetical protein
MTMSTDKPDLVAQLRDTSRVLETRGNTCDAMRCEAAADEIDRLRADVERHESYGGELEGRLAEQAEQVARLTAERDAIEGVAVELRRFQWYGYREDDEAFRSSREDVRKAAGLNVPAGEGGAP